MVKSQVVLGIVFIAIGAPLLLIPFIGWIYGTIAILIGIALIVFRNKESEIEPIKKVSKK